MESEITVRVLCSIDRLSLTMSFDVFAKHVFIDLNSVLVSLLYITTENQCGIYTYN